MRLVYRFVYCAIVSNCTTASLSSMADVLDATETTTEASNDTRSEGRAYEATATTVNPDSSVTVRETLRQTGHGDIPEFFQDALLVFDATLDHDFERVRRAVESIEHELGIEGETSTVSLRPSGVIEF